VQEGENPPEDPAELRAEVDRTFSRMLELVTSINRTNAATVLEGRKTIADGIAERDNVAKKRDLLAGLAEAASTRQDRYSKSEVQFVATVPWRNCRRNGDGDDLRL
jgi:hypothetical protein